MSSTGSVGRVLDAARVDHRPALRQPMIGLVALATLTSIVTCLAADALLVKLGTSLFPSIAGDGHFGFANYGPLTMIGVLGACVAWPLTTRITSAPRWLFLRTAIVVSGLLLLPDVWLLVTGESAGAVAVLVAMHVAIALLTYNFLVRGAPVGPSAPAGRPAAPVAAGAGSYRFVGAELPGDRPVADRPRPTARRRPGRAQAPWLGLIVLLAAEFLLGIIALVVIPNERPNGWVPSSGQGWYLVHAVLGGVLGLVAGLLLLTRSRRNRLAFNSALVGLVGVGIGGIGGLITESASWRIAGLGLMLIGTVIAFFAYATGMDL